MYRQVFFSEDLMFQAGEFRQDVYSIGRIFLRENGSDHDQRKMTGIGKKKDSLNSPKQKK